MAEQGQYGFPAPPQWQYQTGMYSMYPTNMGLSTGAMDPYSGMRVRKLLLSSYSLSLLCH